MAQLPRSKRAAQSPLMADAIEAWLTALAAGGRTAGSIRTYGTSLQQCDVALGGPRLAEVTATEIERFIAGCRAQGMAPSTVSTRFRNVRSFFLWCVKRGLLERAPTAAVLPPTIPHTEPEGYEDDELVRLVDACDPRTPLGARDRALMLTLAGTGLRLAEVLSLRREHLVKAGPQSQYLVIPGKGHKERQIVLEPRIREALAVWLMHRGDDGDPHLWIGERGPLSQGGVYQAIRRRAQAAGVAGAHPHRFRRYALSAMLRAGMDPAAVQRLSGHANLAMLQHYVGHNEERRANDRLLEAAPLDRVNWGSGKRKRKG